MPITFKVLFFILKCTFVGFGGGNALMPFIRKEAVLRHKWLTDEEFDEVVITTNLLPGPSVVETLSYIAIKVLGKWKGTLVSLIGIFPHILLALGLFIIAQKYLPEKYLIVINVSVMPVIVGVILAFSIRYIRLSKKEVGLPLMLALSIGTIGFCVFIPSPYNIPSLVMIAILLVVFVIAYWQEKKRRN